MGAGVWAYVLGWTRLPLNFGDWADINVPRLMFVSNAISSGTAPLHMLNTHSLHGVTDRFFSLPDVITTPQMMLLPVLGIPRFILFDVVLHYSFGVAGLLALRRRFQWSLFSYAVVFALFLFNGHIVSHYSVGHFTWAAYFLFPAVAVLCFQLLDGDTGWRWVSRFGFLMFYMVLAGGQHHFTWVLMFLACLIPFCLDRAKWIIAAALSSGLLSAVRLLPPALNLEDFGKAGWMSDVIGYPSALHIFSSMVELRRQNVDAVNWPMLGNFVHFEVQYYEYSYYVGVVGAIVILYFGVYEWLKERHPMYPQLIVPTFVMVALSVGSLFRIVRATVMPLVLSERLVSRMLSLPMSLLIIVAGVLLQKFINRTELSVWNRLTALALFGLLAIDLGAGVRLMRVAETARTMTAVEFDDTVGKHAPREDAAYTRTLAGGLVITLGTAASLLFLASRERRSGAVST